MTTCPTCAMMCATTDEQYAHRQTIMAHSDDVHIAPCPRCGSTDWATSKEYIGKEPGKPPEPRWWQRPPSWEQIRVGFIGLAIGILMGIWLVPWEWLRLFYATILGTCIAGASNAHFMLRQVRHFDEIKKTQDELRETNSDLGQALAMMSQYRRDPPPAPPIAPTMN